MARQVLVPFLAGFAWIAAAGCNGDDCADDKKIEAWTDADGDGYGTGDPSMVCEIGGDQADNADDCDDESADIHPDAEEACNGLDDNCNLTPDEGLPQTFFFRDVDLDGFGDPSSFIAVCDAPDDAWSRVDTDCDDGDAERNPDAPEICNDGKDDDCDELADDADDSVDPATFTQWYQDRDADGYGRDGATTAACAAPTGAADNGDDCNDNNVDVNPNALEICNDGRDDDCDDLADDLDDSLDTSGQVELFVDADHDGFGEPGSSIMACGPSPEAGASDNEGDCDDTSEYVNPARPETRCDSIDNDCDKKTTDDTDIDLDGWMFCGGDCLDTNENVNPDAEEIAGDGFDSDCDMMELCYQDTDKDGSRTTVAVLTTDIACNVAPDVGAARPIDCDDTDPAIVWSGDWELDSDGDGFSDGVVALHQCTDPGAGYLLAEDGVTDCDDTTGEVYPANPVDPCNDGVDADCNGLESCATCEEWRLTSAPGLASGIYAIRPGSPQVEFDVYCDMTTDGGGWTLVGSSTLPFNDVGAPYFDDVTTLTPAAAQPGVYDLAGYITGNTDVRFACKLDPADTTFAVDLSFYDTDWYAEIAAAANDGQSCFSDGAAPDPTPARRDNLTAVSKDATDAYDSGDLIGEDACNDARDFTVDFDDAGMNSNEDDGTDWGEDDNVPKCGTSNAGGAWFMFVRE